MGALLLRLKHVPDDEYQEVCELLEQNDLAFYETASGFWGVGMAGLWLHDAAQLSKAHALLNDYMQNRQTKMQAEYDKAQQLGESRTLMSTFAAQPVTFILYLLGIVVILALTILPFLGLL